MRTHQNFLNLVDVAVKAIKPLNGLVDSISKHLIPTVTAKACWPAGNYFCGTWRGSKCYDTACDTCINHVLYKFTVYHEIVRYTVSGMCDTTCDNGCKWTDDKRVCGSC